MDENFLKYCRFIIKSNRNPKELVYRFVYVTNGEPDEEPLPFPEAFMIGGKYTWVLDMDQITAARLAAGRGQVPPETEEEEEQQDDEQHDDA